MTFIDPVEQASWDSQRTRANDKYKFGQAQSAFQRSSGQANFGLATGNLARRFDQMRESLPGRYMARGLANSGIYGRGLQRHGEDRQSASNDLFTQYQQMLGQIGLQDQANTIDWSNSISGVNSQEMARRAQIAAALKGLG